MSCLRIPQKMKGPVGAATLFFLLVFSFQSQASFKKGLESYKSGEFEEAYFIFKNMAVVGDKPSQFNMGVMYYRGEHVDWDVPTAYAWMALAAENGNETFSSMAAKIFGGLDDKGKEAATQQLKEVTAAYSDESLANLIAPQPLSDKECRQKLETINLVEPVFPQEALVRGLSGYADFTLNLSRQGYARDLTLRSKTHDTFIKPSATALTKSRWEPVLNEGKSGLSRDHYWRMSYLVASPGEGEKVRGRLVDKIIKSSSETRAKAHEGDVVAQYKFAKTIGVIKAFQHDQDQLDTEYQTANKWLLKAAQKGHPLAQYELGKNMVVGRGCEVDSDSGLKWMRAAASAGHPFAQEELAMSELHQGIDDEHRVVYWLRKSAAEDYFKGKIFLAWHLATSSNPEIFAPDEAVSLLNSEPGLYFDDVRVKETHAAVYAALGEFKKAVKWQKKALKAAKKLKWDIPVMRERMEAYQNSQRWEGAYHI